MARSLSGAVTEKPDEAVPAGELAERIAGQVVAGLGTTWHGWPITAGPFGRVRP